MKKRTIFAGFVILVVGALLIGCAPSPSPGAVREEIEVTRVAQEVTEVDAMALPTASPAPTLAPGGETGGRSALPALPARASRMIIKDAQLKLEVSETDVAIDGVTQVVEDCGGYIVSSRVWYEERRDESYKYAALTLGVPVDQFERALRRLRGLAVRVVDETAAGQDVTDEYVDLQSRVRNLEATRDRIRGFLDQATSVEEALLVNEQLAAVEAQIEQVQGRVNYLADRAAYSTITVHLDPELPPAPTPTPTPAPEPWQAAPTVRRATGTLRGVAQALAELAIWAGIVGVPLLAPLALVVWLLRRRVEAGARPRPASDG
jgi:hypothetical protein